MNYVLCILLKKNYSESFFDAGDILYVSKIVFIESMLGDVYVVQN